MLFSKNVASGCTSSTETHMHINRRTPTDHEVVLSAVRASCLQILGSVQLTEGTTAARDLRWSSVFAYEPPSLNAVLSRHVWGF